MSVGGLEEVFFKCTNASQWLRDILSYLDFDVSDWADNGADH